MQDKSSTSETTHAQKAQDNIAVYQAAMQALGGRENDNSAEGLALKHKAVLALARTGATQQAQSEYRRFGLERIRHHEDIMALKGRLFKDRYSVSKDIEDARVSASAYEAAFQDTEGYYSGINAATMSLLANIPSEIVLGRAQAVLTRLSDMSGDSPEDRYFIQASRAEAHYILGDRLAAQDALQAALDYDPLNYTAHASTYRQFQLLSDVHGEATDWFSPLRAPMAVHFAGHLFDHLDDEDRLKIAVSDLIQKEDIGFGFGALAAGSDIVFAETLLEEGGELHIILPVPVDVFKSKSVTGEGLGKGWLARFDACLAQAASLRCVSAQDVWPDPTLNNFAARIAMGGACMKASELSTQAAQLLLWDRKDGASLTAQHAADWQAAQKAAPHMRGQAHREQFILEFPESRNSLAQRHFPEPAFEFVVMLSVNGQVTERFATASQALSKVQALLTQTQLTDGYGLHIGLKEKDIPDIPDKINEVAQALAKDALPGSLLVSQDMAALLSLEHSAQWQTGFTGWSQSSGQRLPAFFARYSEA